MSLTVYQYPKCSTCRKALKWLDERGIATLGDPACSVEEPRAEVRGAAGVDDQGEGVVGPG